MTIGSQLSAVSHQLSANTILHDPSTNHFPAVNCRPSTDNLPYSLLPIPHDPFSVGPRCIILRHGGKLHPLTTPPPEGTAGSSHQSPRQAFVIVVLCDLLVLTVYVWMASVGTWTQWPTHWQLYDQLATSFRHGQLALEQKPDPALLALPDPYDPAARQGIASPQDLSLYKGRFYLYWGPVPALLLVPIKSLIPGTIGDQYVGFAFIAGIFLLQSYLIATIRRLFFPSAPAWTLAPLILAAGLTNPWPWLIGTPSIYNASITGGQFFFLAGLCVAFSAFRRVPVSVWRLIVAGILWAAALGSRINLLLPVAFLGIVVVLTLALEHGRLRERSRMVPAALGLLVPLGMGLAALGWYNWARFGSVFDVGFQYQLAGIYKTAHAADLFSPRYILQNLYAYLLNPPGLKYPFPYFFPTRGPNQSLLPGIALPSIYRAQEISGLLYSAPFVVLALLPTAGLFGRRQGNGSVSATAPRFAWLVIALAGSFLLTFSLFAAYFWVGERFVADFMPSLFLLACIGFFQLDTWLAVSPAGSALTRLLWMVLIAASILLGILMAISFNPDGFRQLNPLLWRQLSNLFRP